MVGGEGGLGGDEALEEDADGQVGARKRGGGDDRQPSASPPLPGKGGGGPWVAFRPSRSSVSPLRCCGGSSEDEEGGGAEEEEEEGEAVVVVRGGAFCSPPPIPLPAPPRSEGFVGVV